MEAPQALQKLVFKRKELKSSHGVSIGRKAGVGIPMLAAVRQWEYQYKSAVDSDEGVFGR